MPSKFRSKLAILWCEIARQSPREIFAKCPDVLRRAKPGDKWAQPGYVGPDYRRGGVVFVAANPGGAKVNNVPSDKEQDALLRGLKTAPDSDCLSRFEDVMAHLTKSMQADWAICKVVVRPVLESAGLDFEEIAFINLLKWRTVGEKCPTTVLEASWRLQTKSQIALLGPRVVVGLGTTVAGSFLTTHVTGAERLFVIKRSIGDKWLPPEGKRTARAAGRYISKLRVKRP